MKTLQNASNAVGHLQPGGESTIAGYVAKYSARLVLRKRMFLNSPTLEEYACAMTAWT
jgi:hypothetical protein